MNRKPLILLVDDDPDDLMLLKDAIDSLGENYQFIEAFDGRSALNMLRQATLDGNLPCLVVLDINMPILDGREMLAIMKSDLELKELPAVVFTTSSNPVDTNYCRQFNVQLFTKPFNITMLKDVAMQIISFCKV